MVLPAPATVPARVLAWLVAAERLGELHLTLAPAAQWQPPSARNPWSDETAERLTVLGWRDSAGKLEREVVASLTVLCRPVVEMFGWMTHAGATIGVLAARIGKDAMLAVRTPDGRIGLSSIPAGRLAERLVAQAPLIPPGPGKPLSVSPADLRSVNRAGRQLTSTGAIVRKAGPDARHTRQLLSQPGTGGGELWVATRDSAGRRHVIERPLRYADIDNGRHQITVSGAAQVRLIPAGCAQLVTALNLAYRTLPVGART
ncbi:ESX secretion-associated protein EspG [Actinophytocola sp.]|uniref:ESX secretion-associated protein EspG n=1 Tax=Actinophytocola sp. TaxID=1872138 RepID=UPI0025BBF93F|nr:ESX secretion-associated protein EspG [Actinophytocola sp.]